jgi:hypothetical protein
MGTLWDRVVNTGQNITAGNQGDPQGFSDTTTFPSKGGFGVRQSRVQNERDGIITRNMVRWFLPETGIVQMYINPQSIKYNEKKHITSTRTRNGYVIQYWGEELGTVNISGTTGSSGVEGINVLYDIYRNEQVSLDPLALAIQAKLDQDQSNSDFNFGADFLQSAGDSLLNSVSNLIEFGDINPNRPKPTLASMAFQVEMYWSGWVFRGYFTEFSVDESADRLGLFNYTMNFTVTQRRGLRLNFLPWHRSAVDGPSNSEYGTNPHSYGALANPEPTQTVPQERTGVSAPPRTVQDGLASDSPLIVQPRVRE